ncbi:MAG: hypothetical protein HPY50_06990 [Firmicutes bacterium]|nr:hypothetical protein [Bacillota bacterium]
MQRSSSTTIAYLLSAVLFILLLASVVFYLVHPRTVVQRQETPYFDEISASQYFPLAPGNRWVYQGVVKYTSSKGELLEQPVEVAMSVTGVVSGGDATLYLMSGHPGDFAGSLPEKPTSGRLKPPAQRYGYLVVANKVYLVSESDLEEVSAGVSKGSYLPQLYQTSPEFEFPLFPGQRFGEASQLARADRTHFWYVEEKNPTENGGDQSAGPAPVYGLTFRTSPDTIGINFQPYLGITSYSYQHHGTPLETSLELVDYYLAPR